MMTLEERRLELARCEKAAAKTRSKIRLLDSYARMWEQKAKRQRDAIEKMLSDRVVELEQQTKIARPGRRAIAFGDE